MCFVDHLNSLLLIFSSFSFILSLDWFILFLLNINFYNIIHPNFIIFNI